MKNYTIRVSDDKPVMNVRFEAGSDADAIRKTVVLDKTYQQLNVELFDASKATPESPGRRIGLW